MTDLPSYDQLEERLRSAHSGLTAAELHGSLCAQLSASPELPGSNWVDVAAGASVPRDALGEATWDMLAALYDWTLRSLDATDFTFELFLPDEQETLERRAEALGLWCSGFLSGLGQTGYGEEGRLPDEAGEFVKDLAEMARADFDTGEPGEDDEKAFFELVEYTRMGAMVVFETLRGPQEGAAIH